MAWRNKWTDMRWTKRAALALGPAAAVLLTAFFDLSPDRPEVTRMAAVALWMAIWWIGEAVPLGVTALLPVALFPALGVMDGRETAALYMNHIIFLFLGGFITALAMEKWGLHKRIALSLLARFGARPRAVLLGFMAVTAFLSMWISNTATAMMMAPIALAVVGGLVVKMDADEGGRYAKAVLLGIAYSASIGGVATLIGTPPNLILARQLAIQSPEAAELSFSQWLAFAAPLAVVFLALAWVVLMWRYSVAKTRVPPAENPFREQLARLGRASPEERTVFAGFAAMAFLWLFRADIALGPVTIPGWSRLFANPGFWNDGAVAVGVSVLLFAWPSRTRAGERIMDWETAKKLPWEIVLLFGGGFALAGGFKASGLSLWLAERLAGAAAYHPLAIVLAMCLLITFLTELTSNTATAQIFLPVMGALALSLDAHPLLLMIPAALSCSFAFMLPVATPPNAIVFGSGRLSIPDMARTGLALNLLGALLTALYVYFFGSWLLGEPMLPAR